jgi:uncharacterized protein YggU (UPF0235/DUF167 family)
MRIIVKAKTRAKENKVERVGQPAMDFGVAKPELIIYKVSVKEAPVAGKANEAIIRALAKYFDTAEARIRLVSGQSSKQKIFEIE